MQATSPVTRPHERSQSNTVGQLLRDWRTARGISQLDLAMHAGFSARHVSFIETGRTQPSRQALLVLAESLDIPLRERNRLLEAGGFAHIYRHTPFAAEEMSHIRGVLQFILDRHKLTPPSCSIVTRTVSWAMTRHSGLSRRSSIRHCLRTP